MMPHFYCEEKLAVEQGWSFSILIVTAIQINYSLATVYLASKLSRCTTWKIYLFLDLFNCLKMSFLNKSTCSI